MSITFKGDYPPIQRIVTGFDSLDTAMNNENQQAQGIPLSIWNISGWSGVGKSTFVLSLAGMIAAAQSKHIAITPIEELDKSLMESILTTEGFSGEVNILLDSNDEKSLDKLIEKLADEDIAVGILDSVGAISPIAELEADSVADVNMGRRAQLMAKLSRHIRHIQRFRQSPLTFFMISHQHMVIGGRGTTTSGGTVKDYMSKIYIRLKRSEEFDGGSYILEGSVEKLSFGQGGRKFKVFCLSGKGLHKGLSAIIDCETLKLAKRENGVVRLAGKSYGRLSKIIAQADTFDFSPFFAALQSPDTVSKVDTPDDIEVIDVQVGGTE